MRAATCRSSPVVVCRVSGRVSAVSGSVRFKRFSIKISGGVPGAKLRAGGSLRWYDRANLCPRCPASCIRGEMSDSLAGGLVPLGSRAGSGTGGSKSTLSGGLIPLGNKSRPTASFDRAAIEEKHRNGEVSSSGWDHQEEEGSGLRKEGIASGLHPDKKVRFVIFIVLQPAGILTQTPPACIIGTARSSARRSSPLLFAYPNEQLAFQPCEQTCHPR